jgi:hypothetical protein
VLAGADVPDPFENKRRGTNQPERNFLTRFIIAQMFYWEKAKRKS